MTASARTVPDVLVDGAYLATCRERNALAAVANGHSQVFPQARMIVKDGWAHFYRNGEEVWTCNVHYAAANFVIQAT
ncbi:hypothetical protein NYZ96_36055 (plasmid) [Burkholderia gladioli]|uniref:Uncharacterized protein n=1 Tax=Burkholderia gladioli TaxID=28095 RepID=A0AB38U684_BURGA|nr:hypothetical protein [Burkholderia gladioli]AYQ85980.1 hypothetical protein EDD84_00090 [Burkholderia gladioli]UWX75436.1 hypothetical protein NYZ96_36055 [Burkholderia gladioli]